MKPPIQSAKSALRRQLSEENRRHNAEECNKASEQICFRLLSRDVWQRAESVLLFSPIEGEPDIAPLIRNALSCNKNVTLPRYVKLHDSYEACQITNLQTDARPGHFGILEPNKDCPVFSLNRLDFVLVPGVGFDIDGWRLGRGKGFYDQLLVSVRGIKCGVAFDWQVVSEVPTESHDIRLNCILTPTRWLEIAS